MPTGSGKSAVFMALPFLLRANRVLIMTTSRVVCDQLTEDYGALSTLKALGAVAENCPSPRVRKVSTRAVVKTLAEERSEYDVAVAVPAAFQAVDLPESLPADLFDLLIVDEAHHLAVPTWTVLTAHLSAASQALFTATPVRRDRKKLKARYVYVYTLADALRDGVFRVVNFRPVVPRDEQAALGPLGNLPVLAKQTT